MRSTSFGKPTAGPAVLLHNRHALPLQLLFGLLRGWEAAPRPMLRASPPGTGAWDSLERSGLNSALLRFLFSSCLLLKSGVFPTQLVKHQ
jgi:hypothetical protein